MKDPQLENNIISLHARGWPIRRLSNEFRISRERVRRILHSNAHERSSTGACKRKKPGKQGSKLDAYKELIKGTLEKYIDPPPTNQRIFEIIKQKGFDGGDYHPCKLPETNKGETDPRPDNLCRDQSRTAGSP